MRRQKYELLGTIFFSTCISVYLLTTPSLEKLEAFGKFRVGDKGVSFSGHTDFDQEVGPNVPPGKFHIHLFTNNLPDHVPVSCLDQECGPRAATIIKLGGHLHVTRDLKLPKIYGLKTKHKKKKLVFEHSLAIVESPDRIILAIFKNAELSNLDEIVKMANLE